MADKIGLFNAALAEMGHDALVDTGEAVEAGRLLNRVYSRVVNDCLSVGGWNFAMEDDSLDGDTGLITDRVGPQYGFSKPTDWVRTVAVSLDEFFSIPLTAYYDDADIWKADSTPLYVRYVSNDTGLGFDLARWPHAFTRYVELELASRTCYRLTQGEGLKERIDNDRDRARRAALNQYAMNGPQPKFPPEGSWSTSRGGIGRRDRGNRNTLIG